MQYATSPSVRRDAGGGRAGGAASRRGGWRRGRGAGKAGTHTHTHTHTAIGHVTGKAPERVQAVVMRQRQSTVNGHHIAGDAQHRKRTLKGERAPAGSGTLARKPLGACKAKRETEANRSAPGLGAEGPKRSEKPKRRQRDRLQQRRGPTHYGPCGAVPEHSQPQENGPRPSTGPASALAPETTLGHRGEHTTTSARTNKARQTRHARSGWEQEGTAGLACTQAPGSKLSQRPGKQAHGMVGTAKKATS